VKATTVAGAFHVRRFLRAARTSALEPVKPMVCWALKELDPGDRVKPVVGEIVIDPVLAGTDTTAVKFVLVGL
jgi:hypothetical protein